MHLQATCLIRSLNDLHFYVIGQLSFGGKQGLLSGDQLFGECKRLCCIDVHQTESLRGVK